MKLMVQKKWTIFVMLLTGLFTADAFAQVASALLVEGQPLPGVSGHTVVALNNTAVNHADGYAVAVNSTDGSATLSHVWGHATGDTGDIIFTETTVDDYLQSSFESFIGFSNTGRAAYSATATHIPSSTSGLDGVWVNDTEILVEEQPFPDIPGKYSSFNSRAGITEDGNIYWVGGYTSTPGGSTENRALLHGSGASILLKGGDMVGGVTYPVTTGSGIDFNVRMSRLGTYYIMEVILDSISSGDDGVVVINGEAMMAGGSIVREGSPVPLSIGGLTSESWENFDYFCITENGDTMVTGDTNTSASLDEFIMVNGTIKYREGDDVDGQILSGAVQTAYMNENTDVAYVWPITAGSVEALFVNDQLVLKEGDTVDLDGNGIPETDSILVDFTGINALTMGDRDKDGNVDVYFTADVQTPAITAEAFLRLTVPTGPPSIPLFSGAGSFMLIMGFGFVLIAVQVLFVGRKPLFSRNYSHFIIECLCGGCVYRFTGDGSRWRQDQLP